MRKTVFNATADPRLVIQMSEIADERGTSFSAVVSEALEKYVETHQGSENDEKTTGRQFQSNVVEK